MYSLFFIFNLFLFYDGLIYHIINQTITFQRAYNSTMIKCSLIPYSTVRKWKLEFGISEATH